MACTEEQCSLNMENLEKRMIELRSDKPERLDIPSFKGTIEIYRVRLSAE